MHPAPSTQAERRYALMICIHEHRYTERVQRLGVENMQLIHRHSEALNQYCGDFASTRRYHHRQSQAAYDVFVNAQSEVQLDCQLRPALIRARQVCSLDVGWCCWLLQCTASRCCAAIAAALDRRYAKARRGLLRNISRYGQPNNNPYITCDAAHLHVLFAGLAPMPWQRHP